MILLFAIFIFLGSAATLYWAFEAWEDGRRIDAAGRDDEAAP